MKEQNYELATTILNQLGGKQFSMMVGMKDLSMNGNTIQFKIGRNNSKANMVSVTLEDNDTYTIKFFSFRKMVFKELDIFENIYCDQLQKIFTDYTGLYTKLF